MRDHLQAKAKLRCEANEAPHLLKWVKRGTENGITFPKKRKEKEKTKNKEKKKNYCKSELKDLHANGEGEANDIAQVAIYVIISLHTR